MPPPAPAAPNVYGLGTAACWAGCGSWFWPGGRIALSRAPASCTTRSAAAAAAGPAACCSAVMALPPPRRGNRRKRHGLPWALLLGLLGLGQQLERGGAEDEVDPLLHHLANDPHGDQDVFWQLSASEMENFVDDHPELGVDELLEKAQAFPLSTHVNVKLIGWDGQGRYGVKIDEKRLQEAFRELHSDQPVSTVRPAALGSEGSEGRTLPIADKFYFSVEHAGGKLTQALNAAVGGAISARQLEAKAGRRAATGSTARVPQAVVDDLLGADFDETALSYTIYIANLNPPGLAPGDAGAYSYASTEQLGGGGCHVSHWPSPSQTQRYAFIDVSAHCGRFGPKSPAAMDGRAAGGVVNARLLPSLLNHASATELQEAGWQWDKLSLLVQRDTELMGDLVSFVWRTCKLLVAPSIAKEDLRFEEDLTVHLKVISDHGGATDGRLSWWHALAPQLEQLGLKDLQSVHLSQTDTTFDECRECGAAFSHALRGHRDSDHSLQAAEGRFAAREPSQYLDSAELHAWLGHYHAPSGSASSGRNWRGRANVLTVYLFDLARDESLLLDRESEVVAFDDMVIAVQTNTPHATSGGYTCDDFDGERVNDGGDVLESAGTGRGGADHKGSEHEGLAAGVLSALLQAGWGVAPTHLTYSPLHGAARVDLLWSLAGTPSSPFARGDAAAKLNWAQADASRRNLLLSLLNARLTELAEAVAPLQRDDFDMDLGRVLTKAETVHFSKRWQLLNHKLDRFATEMYLNNFAAALYFVRSAEHDIIDLNRLAHDAKGKTTTTLDCSIPPAPMPKMFKERVALWGLVGVGAGLGLMFNKRRQRFS